MLIAAALAAIGTHHMFAALALGRRNLALPSLTGIRGRSADWLAQAGVIGVGLGHLIVVETIVFGGVALLTWIVFGSLVPAVLAGAFGASALLAAFRSRRRTLRDEARAAWPYLIEDIRLLTGAVGRSVPVALIEAGRKSPTAPMRAAFDEAQREWLLTTDLHRATTVVKAALADATADIVCETLLVAHEIGGADLDHRLVALIDDRRADIRHREEARSRQAGARFARWFVLVVPVGMAVVGLTIGDGRGSYRSTGGQVAVVAGISLIAACWAWASRIMRLPEPERVFRS